MPGGYELASMHFVAEGASEDFAEFCGRFARSVLPGGRLVAAFMENVPTYRIGLDSCDDVRGSPHCHTSEWCIFTSYTYTFSS